jgi:hypothetical protein
MNAGHEIHDAIIDATVTDTVTGDEVLDVSACYLALAQDLNGTLPEGLQVEWGPCATHRKRVINEAPAKFWFAALDGKLVLHLEQVKIEGEDSIS